MKINKWTLGLAAVGLVSLASVAHAEEKTAIMTALSATTISGYVDTSVQWQIGQGAGQTANPPGYAFNTPNKQNGFNLDVVNLVIEKPLDDRFLILWLLCIRGHHGTISPNNLQNWRDAPARLLRPDILGNKKIRCAARSRAAQIRRL